MASTRAFQNDTCVTSDVMHGCQAQDLCAGLMTGHRQQSAIVRDSLVGALPGGALRVDGLHIPAGIVPDEDPVHAVLAPLASLHHALYVSAAVIRRCSPLGLLHRSNSPTARCLTSLPSGFFKPFSCKPLQRLAVAFREMMGYSSADLALHCPRIANLHTVRLCEGVSPRGCPDRPRSADRSSNIGLDFRRLPVGASLLVGSTQHCLQAPGCCRIIL